MNEQHSQQKGFIPVHGGYRDLRPYQKAEIIYDSTVYFCHKFLEKRDRKGIEYDNPEIRANVLIGLIRVASYLLSRQLRYLEQEFLKQGGLCERMTKARLQARNKDFRDFKDFKDRQGN